MGMPLITPPDYEAVPLTTPLLLLFGPRKGAIDWQNPTAKWFLTEEPDMCVASTRSHEWSVHLTEVQRRQLIKNQKEWVAMYIHLALERIIERKSNIARAAIMVWCAKEEILDSMRNYAPATRIAIGKMAGWINGARGRNIFDDISDELPDGLFVGAEEGFGGRRDLEIALELHGRPLYSSLEEMERDTLRYLRGKNEAGEQ